MKVTVSVTEEDIARGQRCESQSCPIALALARLRPGLEFSVGSCFVSAGDGGDRPRDLRLPDRAARFVEDFDAGSPVEPFAFDLDFPE